MEIQVYVCDNDGNHCEAFQFETERHVNQTLKKGFFLKSWTVVGQNKIRIFVGKAGEEFQFWKEECERQMTMVDEANNEILKNRSRMTVVKELLEGIT